MFLVFYFLLFPFKFIKIQFRFSLKTNTLSVTSNLTAVTNNYIAGLNSDSNTKECKYTSEETNKYLLIDNRQASLFLLKDSTFCFAERNLLLEEDMVKFDLIN